MAFTPFFQSELMLQNINSSNYLEWWVLQLIQPFEPADMNANDVFRNP